MSEQRATGRDRRGGDIAVRRGVAIVEAGLRIRAAIGVQERRGQSISCASSGYTGTKLTWCQNICEKGYTGATLDMWIHRWINRYRDVPYCGLGEEEGPQQPE